MEPVMKFDDYQGITRYLFHAERVHDIHDLGKPGKPLASMRFDVNNENSVLSEYRIAGITARDLKRNIQDNEPEKLGFLKLSYNTDFHGPQARRYLNVVHVVSVSPGRIYRMIDGQRTEFGAAMIQTRSDTITVEGAPFAVAAQIRRILKRLDQDEEFCCDAPESEAESDSE